jgi:hypothetical protein
LVLVAIAAVVILIEPLPTPPISQAAFSLLQARFSSLNPQSFAPGYFVGYAVANAHVLQVVLLVGALYFGLTKRPWFSALLFAFGAFDPRAAIIMLPLLLWYNRQRIRSFAVGAIAILGITNLPFFFYYGIGFSFLHQEVSGNIISQMYPYDWLAIYAVVVLTIIEIINVTDTKLNLTPTLKESKKIDNQMEKL